MSRIIFVVGLALLALVACKKDERPECKNGDACDYTKGT
jgi:hypothetical protein